MFVFADPPHLLKLIRNNFIDSGFYYKNIFINKRCLEEMLILNKNDSKIAFKIEPKHLDGTGAERQKVSLAVQLFSNNTAKSVRWFGLSVFFECDIWNEG